MTALHTRIVTFAAAAILTGMIVNAPASAAVFMTGASVTEVTGENLGLAFGASLPPGSPANLTINAPEGFTLADLFDSSPFQVAVDLGAPSALIQTCCLTATEMDASDGEISLSGFLGGFTGPSFGVYDLFAGAFEISFSVDAVDIPAAPLATSEDLIAFLSAASLAVEGFVEGVFVDQSVPDGPAFAQQVHFSTAPVPIPGALWLFASGLGLLAARRRIFAGR